MDLYIKPYSSKAAEFLGNRVEIVKHIKENLLKVQERMKFFADAHCIDRSFAVGDEVYLKLQPFRQKSVVLRSNLKLTGKYYALLRYLRRLVKWLTVCSFHRVHDVFHVSFLKKHIKNGSQLISQLLILDQSGICTTTPELILDSRQTLVNGKLTHEVLVQWQGIPPQQATWENFDVFHSKLPFFDPWGQGSALGGVMSWPVLIWELRGRECE